MCLGTARELYRRVRSYRLKVGRAAGSPVRCTETGRDVLHTLKIHRKIISNFGTQNKVLF